MTSKLIVMYECQVAGALTKLKGGDLRLQSEDAYRFSSEATPLSTHISLSESEHKGASVTNWLWGLPPDSETVLRR